MNLISISSCSLFILNRLQDHLLPCPFKYFTGIDCPGCGFQRSVLALLQGNIRQSFTLYPPAIPLIIFLLWGIADRFMALDNPKHTIKKTMFVIMATTIMVSYGLKITHLYLHYKVSV